MRGQPFAAGEAKIETTVLHIVSIHTENIMLFHTGTFLVLWFSMYISTQQ